MNTPHSSERILAELKHRGPLTAGELGELLGISAEGTRQHLLRLAGDGLVAASSSACGVGRPALRWHLTEHSKNHFPDAHTDLVVQLLNGVRHVFGDDAIDKLADAREGCMLRNYEAALDSAQTLEERIAKLAELRTGEGYMAHWQSEGENFLLIEDHCPIHVAAQACQTLCRSELQLFRNLLGPDVKVEREEHIVSGARRCVYRIVPAHPN